jgi:hypothetical protein
MGLDIDNILSKTKEPSIPSSAGEICGEIDVDADCGGSSPAHARSFPTSDRIDCATFSEGLLWQQ